jgi:hypothetical protein
MGLFMAVNLIIGSMKYGLDLPGFVDVINRDSFGVVYNWAAERRNSGQQYSSS